MPATGRLCWDTFQCLENSPHSSAVASVTRRCEIGLTALHWGAGDHRLRRGHLAVKKGPQDRREPSKEGWYMQRLPKGDQTWTDIYFFHENVCTLHSSLSFTAEARYLTICANCALGSMLSNEFGVPNSFERQRAIPIVEAH